MVTLLLPNPPHLNTAVARPDPQTYPVPTACPACVPEPLCQVAGGEGAWLVQRAVVRQSRWRGCRGLVQRRPGAEAACYVAVVASFGVHTEDVASTGLSRCGVMSPHSSLNTDIITHARGSIHAWDVCVRNIAM